MRTIELSRSEAELLTDVLFLSDNYLARDISAQIREVFGMCSEEVELGVEKLSDHRKKIAAKILEQNEHS